MEKFDQSYIEMAGVWARNSYCRRRQVGALLVKDRMIISDGYNGTPSGFENVCEDENGVKSVVVVCEGANNFCVILDIREAVAAALGTQESAVKIYQKKD